MIVHCYQWVVAILVVQVFNLSGMVHGTFGTSTAEINTMSLTVQYLLYQHQNMSCCWQVLVKLIVVLGSTVGMVGAMVEPLMEVVSVWTNDGNPVVF